MNIEQIVAEMPKAENPYHKLAEETLDDVYAERSVGFNSGIHDQCRLLAEQGYRKLPHTKKVEHYIQKYLSQFPEALPMWSDGVRAGARHLYRCLLQKD